MWQAIGAAVQGTSHVKSNTPCQDKVWQLYTADGALAAALADGAGSAKYSHFGAAAASKAACEYLGSNFDRLFNENDGVFVKNELLETILRKLDAVCNDIECERRELASTLLAVAVKDNKFILVHLGDGVIGYLKGDELKVASTPNNGEFVNETVFTTSSNALCSVQIKKGLLGEVTSFLFMSDGPEVSLYDKRERRLTESIKNIMLCCSLLAEGDAKAYLKGNLENALKKNTADDCSLMVIVNRDAVVRRLLQNNVFQQKVCGIKTKNPRKITKRLAVYSDLLAYLQEPKTLEQIAAHMGLKNGRGARMSIRSLVKYHVIEQKEGGLFSSSITF